MRHRAVHGLALLAAGSLGCSLLYDFEVEQCRTKEDCQGGAFAEASWTCERGLCVRDSSDAASADAAPECRSNAQCETVQARRVCVHGSCVDLLSNECAEYFPHDTWGDEALILGAFGSTAQPVSAHRLNYTLATEELNQVGIPPERKLVLVVCDDGEPETLRRGFDHLAETLKVPALVAGIGDIDAMQTLFHEQKDEQGLFFLAPYDSDGSAPSPDLLIYLLGHVADYAPAFVPLLERAERYVKTTRELDSVRLAILKPETGFGSVLWNAMSQDLIVNGKRVIESLGDDDGSVRSFDATRTHSDLLADILGFEPDIFLVLTDSELFAAPSLGGRSLFAQLEEGWDDSNGAPLYLLSPQNAFRSEILKFVDDAPGPATAEARQQRFVGIRPASARNSEVLNAYEAEFRARFKDGEDKLGAENYYDAVYYLAYAAIAASPEGGPLRGADVRRGFELLLEGDDVHVGPSGIRDAFSKLGSGIRLIGTLGAPDFDLETGARKGSGSVACLVEEDDRYRPEYDVLFYDEGSKLLEAGGDGAFCFPGF